MSPSDGDARGGTSPSDAGRHHDRSAAAAPDETQRDDRPGTEGDAPDAAASDPRTRGPVHHRVPTEPDDVADHWSPERRAEARPREQRRDPPTGADDDVAPPED